MYTCWDWGMSPKLWKSWWMLYAWVKTNLDLMNGNTNSGYDYLCKQQYNRSVYQVYSYFTHRLIIAVLRKLDYRVKIHVNSSHCVLIFSCTHFISWFMLILEIINSVVVSVFFFVVIVYSGWPIIYSKWIILITYRLF